MKNSKVIFNTENEYLQNIYDQAEKKAAANIRDYDGYKVLIEGGGFFGVWLESQPMGGEMYAKRNMEVALNNQMIFMDYQRIDGMIPGLIRVDMLSNANNQPEIYSDEIVGLSPYYGAHQGLGFPAHAFNMYFHADLELSYLNKLYGTLERYDEYLWSIRDSDNDGCLELWCGWDTGEDNSVRLKGIPHGWGRKYPPPDCYPAPIASMDFMSYSYAARDFLSKISEIINNGKHYYWLGKAEDIRKKVRDYLWIEEKNACFDRDCNHKFMDILLHNNLRLMYLGVFYQDMADKFVKYHLKNPAEFWTNMPLPSVAANDPAYESRLDINNFSGVPNGLTYQRSIRALENYGYIAELTHIGKKLLQALGPEAFFAQQYDTNTMKPSTFASGDYGPTILASLEFISRLYGINVTPEEVYWSAIESKYGSEYKQIWGNKEYCISIKDNKATALLNEKELFQFDTGFRIVTNHQGDIKFIVRIEEGNKVLSLKNIKKDMRANEVLIMNPS